MRNALPVLFLVLTPALAAGQQAELQANASARASADVPATANIESTGDASADARIDRSAARLEAAGITTTSLAERVQLGRARGVAAARIATAVESRAAALLEARDALRASAVAHSTSLLELSADAIESGAHASAVGTVAAGFRTEERPRALAVLGSLAADGRLGADVLASVRGALGTGASAPVNSLAGGVDAGASTTTSAGGVAASVAGSAAGTVRALPR